jgi:quercetin 2,3-dioxygenase
MSGPVTDANTPPVAISPANRGRPQVVEVTAAREAPVGRSRVRRALPRSGRRTVGAWCFADHFGPIDVTPTSGLDIGPHPHTGLHTVTWLLAGEVLHRDSLGSEQVIRPGQLNLMTAGQGVAHAEEATGTYGGQVEGVQLWVAQPEATRHRAPAFEHHPDLPRVQLERSAATVLVGSFAEQTSPARADTPLVGVDVVLQAGVSGWPLRPDFEYALLVLEGVVTIEDHAVGADHLAYLGSGRATLTLNVTEPARLLLLGGEPFPEPLLMWWNFVARDRAEVEAATRQWNEGDARFGVVASQLPRIPAPPVPPGLRA